MEPKRVEIGKGVAWIGCGWRLFARNPGVWIVMTIVLLVVILLLAFVPFGRFVVTLLAPVFAAGLLYGAAELRAGRSLQLAYLFQGFRDQTKLVPLVVLGAVALAASLLSAIVFAAAAGGSAVVSAPEDPAAIQVEPRVLIGLLLALCVQLVAVALLYFAVPLVMLGARLPGEAMQASVRGCLRNILPLFVFSLIYTVLAFVASVPAGLGWLVLLPWSIGMLCCSYEDIFTTGSLPA